jgi:hypothetical protein
MVELGSQIVEALKVVICGGTVCTDWPALFLHLRCWRER